MRLISGQLNHVGPLGTQNPSIILSDLFFLLPPTGESWLGLSWCRFLNCYTCLLGHVNVILLFSLLFCRALICSLLSLPSISVSLSFFSPLSRSCLFHRALQSLTINKLYVSLCIVPKAPFRKKTPLICPRASVYPKWLHQTWSWLSGRPDCPCWLLVHES